ncbi:MAG: lipid A biosynthesis acyltransferase [Rubrivivax sp.]|nr:lipid A biosynthesis acyltransferase [Rubrivivax sp.]HNK52616.1 lipid A biosynthesis acyltransferase [Ottowia sp.]HNT85744.1 lipid A biosynthesis acyltransferase [Ottowia sp.]HOZ93177.1 lipid A biosynthesis acyltransferase [Ottowia sp.]
MTTHPGVWLMRALAPLPLPWLRALGDVLGRLLFALARRRRHIALVNLRLAFPAWSEAERMDVARRSFIAFAQSFIDRAWVWHAPDAVVRQRIRLTGAVDELRRPEAAVLFAPHFYGMDAGGAAIMQQAVAKGGSIYSPQSGAATDAWVRAGRERFGDVVLINRRDGVKPVVKSLREGRYLYLLPDMDLGPEESVFVPFFGVPAATVPSLPRLARLGRARVVPTVTRMTPGGYEVQVHPAWSGYPGDDPVADTALMNRRLEDWIRTMPEQYYWVHKRFKTRPAGEPSVYGRTP